MIIAIMNLLKRRPSVILSGIILVKMVTLMPALIVADIFYFNQNGYIRNIVFDIIALTYTLGSLILLYFYRRGIKI
jgi:hypothetical protein